MTTVFRVTLLIVFAVPNFLLAQSPPLVMSRAQYEDKAHAVWLAQISGVLLTLPFEHKVAAVAPVTDYPRPYQYAIADDDWYYEMCALRGFEKFGVAMSVDELGQMWKQHNCGTWGSSKAARLAMARGIKPADAGLPQNNPHWFTIGPLFSCELYGLLAPGNPNLAGNLTRELGRINGHAEGLDGGVFSAALVSLAFRENDPHEVVRQAAALIHPDSPFRQSVDLVIQMGEQGKSARQIFDAIEDRWHLEYPATNNAVANGGILAACVWFGEGDYWTSINLAASAGDFIDADNIAAVAAAVAAAMHGTKELPESIVNQLNDRIKGGTMGDLKLTPPVDESISALARRTVEVGMQMLVSHGATISEETISIPNEPIQMLPLEKYTLADLTTNWNPNWTLERAGFGGAGGGMKGIRGGTFLEVDVLATYPRDEVRGTVLTRKFHVEPNSKLRFHAGVDPGRVWNLGVYIDNKEVLSKLIEAPADASVRHWESIEIDLHAHAGSEATIRLFQTVLIDHKMAGNAYWKDLDVR